jgi:pimeloyl-ACP methyl ester carboxylesterase
MMDDRYAEVNGVKLHYAASGKGNLILFLHGFPEFWYAWKNQLAEFGRDHLAVAPDMRGYNLSSKPAAVEQYAVPILVEDVRALAEHLGVTGGAKRFTLVGHDWGGVVAWAFAMAHPELLDKLVIINAPHPAIFARELRDNPRQQRASQYMLQFRAPQMEQFLAADNCAALVENILADGLKKGFFTADDKQAYVDAWSQPGALTGGLNYYRAAHIGPPTGESGEFAAQGGVDPAAFIIKVPTLVVWGEKDIYLLTGNLDGLERFVPNLKIERIPEASHWVIHEEPERVNGLIREFLSKE